MSHNADAHAFWLSAPGLGEIRPVSLPEPGSGDVVVRALRSGVSRGTETLAFRGAVPPRAPFQEGEFPGPVKYGYLSVGAVEEGPAELRGRTVFCLYPHQTAYVVPAGAVTVVPDGVPLARAVLAGTVETAVNALWDAAPLVGDRVAVVGAGMVGLLRRAAARAVPGGRGHLGRRRRVAGGGGGGAGRGLRARRRTRPAAATWSCTRARRPRGCSARSSCSRPRRTVLDLSWYGDDEVRLSLGGAFHSGRLGLRASQVGTVLAGPERAAHDRRPAGAGARAAARPGVRRAAQRRVALRGAARRDGAAGGGEPAGALPHDHLRRGVTRVFSVTVRDHMLIAHSLRGEVFGPAQRLHGATYVVDATFRRAELDADGIVVDIGLASEALSEVVGELSYRNLDDEPVAGRGQHHDRGAREARGGPARRSPARGDSGRSREFLVTLRESHVAWATYERPL